ncbi:MAG: phosphate acyltransferase PlsX [Deltaproteobacteria bacterium]|nr:phosphate acyltransferase PlsX [Deltaproteobacteria bacterium]
MNVAVDAMGGDHAPDVVVQGALQAAERWGIGITLVGNKDVLKDRIGCPLDGAPFKVYHCEGAVSMEDRPFKSVKENKDASIRVAFELCKRGEAAAVVSAGNSGATIAAGILTLGRINGIERPALPGIFPGERGTVILIDVGANVDCRPIHLFQFGAMAHGLAISCLGIRDPKIALLSIGEEGSKGNEQVRVAHDLFKRSGLNFVGNVEGSDLFSGPADIIVCDGFVGNIVLKMSEGIADALSVIIGEELKGSFAAEIGARLTERVRERLKKKLDYAEYGGGAPILGINGVGIVCHGGSSARAIRNAIRMADAYARLNIQKRLSSHMREQRVAGIGLKKP